MCTLPDRSRRARTAAPVPVSSRKSSTTPSAPASRAAWACGKVRQSTKRPGGGGARSGGVAAASSSEAVVKVVDHGPGASASSAAASARRARLSAAGAIIAPSPSWLSTAPSAKGVSPRRPSLSRSAASSVALPCAASTGASPVTAALRPRAERASKRGSSPTAPDTVMSTASRYGCRAVVSSTARSAAGSWVRNSRRPGTTVCTGRSGPSHSSTASPIAAEATSLPSTRSSHTRPPTSPSPPRPPSTSTPSPRASATAARTRTHVLPCARPRRRAPRPPPRRGDRRCARRRGAGGRPPRRSPPPSRARTSATPRRAAASRARAGLGAVDGRAVEPRRGRDVGGALEAPLDLERRHAQRRELGTRSLASRSSGERRKARSPVSRRAPSTTSSYGSRQAWAQAPRLALRPPMASLVRHWPEYAMQSAPCTNTSSSASVSRGWPRCRRGTARARG
jgi:hypothetical protein